MSREEERICENSFAQQLGLTALARTESILQSYGFSCDLKIFNKEVLEHSMFPEENNCVFSKDLQFVQLAELFEIQLLMIL